MRGCCFASPTILYLKYRYLALPVLVTPVQLAFLQFPYFLLATCCCSPFNDLRAPAVLEHSLDSTLRAERGRVTNLFSLNTQAYAAHCCERSLHSRSPTTTTTTLLRAVPSLRLELYCKSPNLSPATLQAPSVVLLGPLPPCLSAPGTLSSGASVVVLTPLLSQVVRPSIYSICRASPSPSPSVTTLSTNDVDAQSVDELDQELRQSIRWHPHLPMSSVSTTEWARRSARDPLV
jgi:hypothetical protein